VTDPLSVTRFCTSAQTSPASTSAVAHAVRQFLSWACQVVAASAPPAVATIVAAAAATAVTAAMILSKIPSSS